MIENEINAPQKEQSEGVDIQDILYLCFSKWHWFILSVLLALGFGTLMILRTPPVYNRYTTIMIKDNTKGGGRSVEQQLSQLGLFENTSVSNEILTFQSPALMTDVVKRLRLNMNYSVEGMFHEVTLYGKTLPVEIRFLSLDNEQGAQMSLKYNQDGSFELTDFDAFSLDDDAKKKIVKGRFHQVVKTPIGRVLVTPTEHFNVLNREIKVEKYPLSEIVNHYGRISVSLKEKESTMVDIAISDVSIERAEDVLKTLIDVYNESWMEDKNQVAVNTSKFINERLRVIESDLGNVDRSISSYKSSNLLPDVESASQLYMQKASANDDKLLELNNQLYMTRYMSQMLSNEKNKFELLPANSGINSSSIESLIENYNNNLLLRNRLIMNSSVGSPAVVELEARIGKQRQAIVASIENLLLTIKTQIRNLEAQEKMLTSKIAQNPTQTSYLASIGREQAVKEALYIFLLQKREENELSMAYTASNLRLITPPTGENKPVSPVKRNIILIAIALGLAVPFAYLYLREMLDTRVRGRKDIKQLTLPYIGEIPHLHGGRDSLFKRLFDRTKTKEEMQRTDNYELVVKPQSSDIINEAFRVLRTNFEFCSTRFGDGTVSMVVSANSGSGKTFLTMNLAMSLIVKGKKAIVVDLDMRKAASSHFIGSPKMGMANYLNGQCELKGIVKKYQDTNLDVIPVGTIPPNPTELLHDEKFGLAIAQLKREYDYIFLDCPPVEIVADDLIISTHVDQTLFVVRAHLLERSMLPEIEDFYRSGRYPNMSLILNGTDDAYRGYGYHRHGYRYGYRYGYGIIAKNEK